MNKIYDKLLLAVGVLALLAGVGFYMMKSGEVPSATPDIAEPSNNPYQLIPVPVSTEITAIWPAAVETSAQAKEAELELYDVFTPPNIYIDENGAFKFKPVIIKPTEEIPFGLYLADIKREAYRVQLEGYIEEDLSDASKSLLLLFDEETRKQVRVRVGQEKPDSEFKLIDFSIERVREESSVTKIVKATLLDQRSGEEVVLTHGERLYTDSTTIILRSHEDSSIEVVLNEAPKAFETTLGKYVLGEINLEESSVTVKKLGSEELEIEDETRKLILSAPVEAVETPEETEPETQEDDQSFDFFN